MSELKRVFSQAKMNKDMDERIVPNGQYRDATNIEIATSEGSEVGTVQTLTSNLERNLVNSSLDNFTTNIMGASNWNTFGPHKRSTVVGCVDYPAKDKIYYFVSGGDYSDTNMLAGSSGAYGETTNNIAKDYIIEYDTVTQRNRYVFVDIFRVYTDVDTSNTTIGLYNFHISTVNSESCGVRVGMDVGDIDGTVIGVVTAVVYDETVGDDGGNLNRWKISTNIPHGLNDNDTITFEAPRILDFSKRRLITGINILGDSIYWTDNATEPKKISITRSIAGTGGLEEIDVNDQWAIFNGDTDFFHTRLVLEKTAWAEAEDIYRTSIRWYPDSTELELNDEVSYTQFVAPIYTNKANTTVIRKGPTQPLELEMYRTSARRVNNAGEETPSNGEIEDFAWVTTSGPSTGEIVEVETVVPDVFFAEEVDYRDGDIILIANSDTTFSPNAFTDHDIRAEIVSSLVTDPNFLSSGPFSLKILSIANDLSTVPGNWYAKLEDKKPMFENMFPRFSYRYRYQDGEYSTFAPWSQIAFLPDRYEYFPKKGYNLGMVNQLRSLILKYYFHDLDIRPQDVVEIDLLYKESGKPTIYTAKTIKPANGNAEWPSLIGSLLDTLSGNSSRGSFSLDTDTIHAVVPSNQILRPYDNVPRRALAQEVSANRLIYGNYLQNYTVFKDPIIKVGFLGEKLSNVESTDPTTGGDILFPSYALPSVKTMRKYQMGVVFSDEYGRETPVLTSNLASIEIPKDWSDTRNRLTCQLDPDLTDIPSWAKYFSYYVKEASVEYYSMAMDRWYSAADGNIWLSFPSSERNKLDDETFLVLKKAHGSNEAVKDKARYRILAIENEAPDFIKTERKVLGRVFDDGSGGVIGNGGSGFPSQDSVVVDISYDVWVGTFGDQLHILTPDSLAIRFFGDNQISSVYEVSQLSMIGQERYKLQLTKRIGPDAAFISTDDTIATVISDLSMELIELETENRPEFDGRFFVKIFKDATLEKYVLNSTVQQFSTVMQTQLGYLNNNGYGSVDPQSGEVLWDTWMLNAGLNEPQWVNDSTNEFYDGGSSDQLGNLQDGVGGVYNHAAGTRTVAGTALHPTEYAHHTGAENIGGQAQREYWWGHGTEIGANEELLSVATYNESLDAYGISAEKIDNFSVLAIGDSTLGSGVMDNHDGDNFWANILREQIFFIDAATAYSWAPDGQTPQEALFDFGQALAVGDTGRPGARGSLDQSDLWEIGEEGDPAVWGTLNDATGGSGMRGNTRTDMGQPSRGIWHYEDEDISYMDISWSGMGNIVVSTGGVGQDDTQAQPGIWPGAGVDANDDDWGTVGEVFTKLGDVSITLASDSEGGVGGDEFANDAASAEQVVFDQAWLFIQALSTPGCMFRFARDPDETVYTVQGGFPTISGGNSVGPGYADLDVFYAGENLPSEGVWGIRNYRPQTSWKGRDFYGVSIFRQRWTIAVSPRIGGGEGSSEYSPVKGTGGRHMDVDPASPTFGTYIGDGPQLDDDSGNYRRALWHDMTGVRDTIEILQFYSDSSTGGNYTNNPAVWETEPKESVDIDIYYQASGLIPLELNKNTNEEYLPVRSNNLGGTTFQSVGLDADGGEVLTTHTITGFKDQTITFNPAIPDLPQVDGTSSVNLVDGGGDQFIRFTKRDTYTLTARRTETGTIEAGATTITLFGGPDTVLAENRLFSQIHYLDWNNCWSFGNGVESDRIRDDYNTAQVDNGVKASSILAEQVREERREHGLIWSGIYNSNSGVNDTNQFIQAEKITKDLNPIYGSIQRLYNRDTRLIMFCEDKILRGVTNKDALYNADGNPQLIASNKVVGDVTPYKGDYGISTNPESLAPTPSTIYFSDAIRGKVLALYDNGIQPISDVGMKDYFSDFMSSYVWRSLGTFDERKKEYNLTVSKKYTDYQVEPHEQVTVSYSELSKGWTSFKSFYPQHGISLNNNYYTFSDGTNNSGSLYEHYAGTSKNSFYEIPNSSDITLLFNDNPEVIKSFMTVNYEGSQANIPAFNDVDDQNYFTGDYSINSGIVDTDNVNDGEYFNLQSKTGWYADSLITNMQTCGKIYFKNKENKYYGYPSGDTTQHSSACDSSILSNLDEAEFSVQGIGLANITHDDSDQGNAIVVTMANRSATTDGWDLLPVATMEALHWTCTEETLCVEAGAIIGDVTVNLTISSIQDGVFSGYNLSAENFELGNYGLVDGLVYTVNGGSNVTDVIDIDTITFSDNGIAGDPTNTVNVAVKFHSDQTWPDDDFTYYVDIDEKENAITYEERAFCFETRYEYWDTTQNTIGSITNNPHWHGSQVDGVAADNPVDLTQPRVSNLNDNIISESVIAIGSQPWTPQGGFLTNVPTINRHSGVVPDGETTMVAEIVFSSNVGHPDFMNPYDLNPQGDPQGYMQGTYYTGPSNMDLPTISFEQLGVYAPYYSSQIIHDGWTMIGQNNAPSLTGFTARILYTPPPTNLLPDLPDMCALHHKVVINYGLKHAGAPPVPSSITGVVYNGALPRSARSSAIRVLGREGTTYKILVQKKVSTTDGSVASTGNYNFATRVFEDNLTADVYTIGSSGINAHMVSFPSVTDDTRYDIVIEGLLTSTGEPAILGPRVPTTAGDASIIKYGVKKLTIQPTTATASNFGTLPTQTITKPARYANDSYRTGGGLIVVKAVGGNSSVSSTKITVTKNRTRIRKGMLLTTPFSGNTIPHNTRVVSTKKQEITLSNAVTLADKTNISFVSKTRSMVPFSLTIPPGHGKTLYLKPEAEVDFKGAIRGLGTGMQARLTAAVSDNISIFVDSGSRAVKAGMAVSGTGIVIDPAYGYARVEAVTTDGSNLRLSTAQTLDDETLLTFTWPEDDPTLPEYDQFNGGNTEVKPVHLQTSLVDGDLLIEGYISAKGINRTDDLSIYIDDFVNVN